jgi:DNA polymerase-3 subunit epsilon
LTPQDKRLLITLAMLALAMLLGVFAVTAPVWATLDGSERDALASLLQSRIALALMAIVILYALTAWALRSFFERYVAAPAHLVEEVQVRMNSETQRDLEPRGSVENRALATAIDSLLRERTQLRSEMALKVAEASQAIEQERSRLAALMSELTQSVVVCNLDGRILLYNGRARAQFRALSSAPALAGGRN